ncbi:MAG: hypothetical protein LBJ17_03830 [Dysgonamonadaceae bacterium]|jgi:hypothetical protein|nr:hypothetical protein [Dysgonamonadaceae bacterium]
MKTKILFLSAILLLSLGCDNNADLSEGDNAANTEVNENPDISLADTQWKLSGIFDVQNNSLKVLNPTDCEECYTINFDTDSTATGKSSSNLVLVDLFGKGKLIGIATEMGETGDGYLFCDAIGLVTSYSCNENELKFFYTENGKEYYLLYVKKENSVTPINITLYDKSPDIIQHYIQGKWQLIYGKGGLSANMIHPYDNHFVEFTSDGQYIYTSPVENYTATIQWDRVAGNLYYSGVDSTYIMAANPLPLLMGEIKNDTLVYLEYYVSDPVFYHCIKINNLKK